MSNKVIGAENQQATRQSFGTRNLRGESSETIRQTPFTEGEIIAYLHGALHDASRNKRTRIRFVQKYPEWLQIIQEMLRLIGSRSWMYREGKERNVYALETTCKDLDFGFDPLQLKSEREKIMYVCGFFDAEGGVPRNSGRFYVQFVQKNFVKIGAVKKLLADLGVGSGKIHNPSRRNDPNFWRLFVGAEHYALFAKRIGSWHPIKQRIIRERMKI